MSSELGLGTVCMYVSVDDEYVCAFMCGCKGVCVCQPCLVNSKLTVTGMSCAINL